MKPLNIVVIEDEADILDVLAVNLRAEGYSVHCESDGESGLETAKTLLPDLILLDLLLPGLDGLEVCRQIRSYPATQHIPIIMVTCKGKEIDKVLGLGIGADDYIVKPFSIDELLARIKAVLRRCQTYEAASKRTRVEAGGLVVDAEKHEALVNGEEVPLTATEFRLLLALASYPGRVFTREQLISQCIGEESAVLDRNIDVHIGSVRKKLGPYKHYVETVRGVGYRFRDLNK
jgi:DNA-binding response OmpR family regulator